MVINLNRKNAKYANVICRKKFGLAGKVDEKLDFLATSKMELFGKRCRKITSFFTAIEQFSSLANVRDRLASLLIQDYPHSMVDQHSWKCCQEA